MDAENLARLRKRAGFYMDFLRGHEVLGAYWERLSLIMKGSTARGYSDVYSDIDFVVFADDAVKAEIVTGYIGRGLSERADGVFLPLGEWEGHYNIDTYSKLQSYFTSRSMVNIWEYTNVAVMHDPAGRYSEIIAAGQKELFADRDGLILEKYLDVQLHLDWMRQPLRRADSGAAVLYASNVLRSICQLLYLLEGKPYPCDKWLFYYLRDLSFPDRLRRIIAEYPAVFGSAAGIVPGLELTDYPLYAKGLEAAAALCEHLKAIFGNACWIDEWYLYA